MPLSLSRSISFAIFLTFSHSLCCYLSMPLSLPCPLSVFLLCPRFLSIAICLNRLLPPFSSPVAISLSPSPDLSLISFYNYLSYPLLLIIVLPSVSLVLIFSFLSFSPSLAIYPSLTPPSPPLSPLPPPLILTTTGSCYGR